WERAIELWLGAAPAYRPVLIHRDYHPTNILWQHDAISGVVDWVNACRGPAGVDVAHCRMNLTLMHGMDLADQFLLLYTELAESFDYHPYWDVDSILDLCLPTPSFYTPWQTFGLGTIVPQVLQQRADTHLERVMTSL
ncbi:MAG: aminoglycoside phosphotransferase family protein, partial [Chloroflexi bacterium]|nr:aminoglycoside phosphotransferase family protein [Chloroflexota bacterium]